MVAFRIALYAAVAGGAGAMGISAPHAWAQQAPASPTAVNLASTAPVTGATDDSATDDTANESASDLAKKLQNPVGDLYSFPFQSNTNFNYGPNKGTQEILNIQPVIPIHVNQDWNIITRTILPLIWQPSLQPAQTVPFGTGPTAAIVYMKGPIVAGALANNIWSFGGTSGPGGTRYNNFLLQPFGNYNFGGGWYPTSAPIITANWRVAGNRAWTLPIGGGFGRVVRIGGKLPVNFGLSAYSNVLRPKYGPTWQLRAQVTLIF